MRISDLSHLDLVFILPEHFDPLSRETMQLTIRQLIPAARFEPTSSHTRGDITVLVGNNQNLTGDTLITRLFAFVTGDWDLDAFGGPDGTLLLSHRFLCVQAALAPTLDPRSSAGSIAAMASLAVHPRAELQSGWTASTKIDKPLIRQIWFAGGFALSGILMILSLLMRTTTVPNTGHLGLMALGIGFLVIAAALVIFDTLKSSSDRTRQDLLCQAAVHAPRFTLHSLQMISQPSNQAHEQEEIDTLPAISFSTLRETAQELRSAFAA
ncbi:MAG: hypothetical protein JKY49_03215 [Cohaesibacteraceae bacterium]|nr:hypothetical protein [Cohaesibacteraceae bacterium]MBL4875547.1 hypothetical protein [Cohaesibacteraceae bacterium]